MAGMRKAILFIAGMLVLMTSLLCFGSSLLDLLIAYSVHMTGVFHGIRFQVRQTMHAAAACLVAAILFLWAGIKLMRAWNSN